MATQTGSLKFRQSDGTYTELYPKTTIAQVDGLQTQLDNINTSLQNKVDYITSKNITLQKQIPAIAFMDTGNTSGNYGTVYFSQYTGVKGSFNFSVWTNTDPAEEMIALRIDVDNLRIVLDINK